MVLVASFPFENWAIDLASAFETMGIPSGMEARGERAWQVYVSEEDEEAAAIFMENTGYLNCAR